MNDEEFLSKYLQVYGMSLIFTGWAVEEANAAVSYVRKAIYRGESLQNALDDAETALIEGKLLPE